MYARGAFSHAAVQEHMNDRYAPIQEREIVREYEIFSLAQLAQLFRLVGVMALCEWLPVPRTWVTKAQLLWSSPISRGV